MTIGTASTDGSVRAWGVWSAITVSLAGLGAMSVVIGASTAVEPDATRIERAFGFTTSFGAVLLGWIVATSVFAGFVSRARRNDTLVGRGSTPGSGLVTTWCVAVVVAVYLTLFFLVFMHFATPTRGMAGEVVFDAFMIVVVDALAVVLALVAFLRAARTLRGPVGPRSLIPRFGGESVDIDDA